MDFAPKGFANNPSIKAKEVATHDTVVTRDNAKLTMTVIVIIANIALY